VNRICLANPGAFAQGPWLIGSQTIMKRVVTHRNRILQALACCPLLLGAIAPMPVALAVGAGSDAQAAATARMVRSFIDFARWPVQPNPVTLCVVGPVANAGQLDGLTLADGRRVARRSVAPAALAGAGCHVAYLGRLEPAVGRQAVLALRGKGVLTIAESDPQCRSQAMFCLRSDRQGLAFSVNIDAISRSGVRVDPRVLRMAQSGGS
jgi:hypothetical protein